MSDVNEVSEIKKIKENPKLREAIQNETDRIAFQIALRARISRQIKIQEDFAKTQSEELKEWQTFLRKHRVMEEVDEITFEQAQTTYNGLKRAYEQDRQKIQALIDLKNSLSNVEEGLLRKSIESLEQVTRKCDQREKDLSRKADKMDEKMQIISNKMNSLPTKSSRRKKLEREIEKMKPELEAIEEEIDEEIEKRKGAIKNFEKNEPKLIKDSLTREQTGLANITRVLQEILSILNIEAPVGRKLERTESKFQRKLSTPRGASFRRANSSVKTPTSTAEL